MSGGHLKKTAPDIELAGLDRFVVSDLMQVDVQLGAPQGKPLDIPLEQILEDPNQARTESNPGFSSESLAELASSIAESGGVKTPISVRSRNAEGFYVVNHGARRLRASRMAGLPTIRGFIDDDHDEYDQAIENIQRESFTPMEIARFIQRREQIGDTRSAIAKRLGKSGAFVTQHASLLTLPIDLLAAYEEGRCRDVLTLYELGNLSKKFPAQVAEFVHESPEITRASAEAFRHAVKQAATGADVAPIRTHPDRSVACDSKVESTRKLVVMVRHLGNLYALRVDLCPSTPRHGWIQEPGGDVRNEVDVHELEIDSIVFA